MPHCQVRPIASVRWNSSLGRRRRPRPAAPPNSKRAPRPASCTASRRSLLGPVPHRSSPARVVGAQRQLDRIIGEAEIAIDRVEQVAERPRLGDDLVLAAEDVGVVLGELAHAHDAVQRAVRLVAVAAAEFGEPQRQVAIGFDALAEDQDMRRAVHRLQRHQVAFAGQDRACPPRCRAPRRGRRTCSRETCPSGPMPPTGSRPSAAAS